jgi:hypothetical protein
MDFIERLFGISPDGGDGSLEALYVIAVMAIIAAVVFRRPLRRWLGSSHDLGQQADQRRQDHRDG